MKYLPYIPRKWKVGAVLTLLFAFAGSMHSIVAGLLLSISPKLASPFGIAVGTGAFASFAFFAGGLMLDGLLEWLDAWLGWLAVSWQNTLRDWRQEKELKMKYGTPLFYLPYLPNSFRQAVVVTALIVNAEAIQQLALRFGGAGLYPALRLLWLGAVVTVLYYAGRTFFNGLWEMADGILLVLIAIGEWILSLFRFKDPEKESRERERAWLEKEKYLASKKSAEPERGGKRK